MKKLAYALCISATVLGLAASAQTAGIEYDTNRQDKQFTAVAQLLGLSTALLGTQQVHLGYFLSPDSLVQLEIGQGNNSGLFNWFSSRSTRVDSLGLQFKKFVGSSFYFKTGADYFVIDQSNDSTFSNYYSFKGSVLGASFTIGNQWHFGNFTLGTDWVGIFLPIASNTTKDVVTAGSTYSREDSDSYQKRYFKESSLQFLRFYLGASF